MLELLLMIAAGGAGDWSYYGGDAGGSRLHGSHRDRPRQRHRSRGGLGVSFRRFGGEGRHDGMRPRSKSRRFTCATSSTRARRSTVRSRSIQAPGLRSGNSTRRSRSIRSGQSVRVPRCVVLGRRCTNRRDRAQHGSSWARTTRAFLHSMPIPAQRCADFGRERRSKDRHRHGALVAR